jgi:glutaredoxin 3
MQTVEIYTMGYCGYCHAAKRLLTHKNAAFTEYSLDSNPGLRSEMMRRAQGRHTVPQIFIGGTHVGGSDDLHALDRAGKLDRLLQG